MVEQNEDRGKYRLGVGVLRLAGATTARLDVVQEARPICRKLAADSGETVNIAVLSDRVRALPRPGRRPVRAAVPQLGRPAHPAARHLQRQGAAERAVRRRDRQPAAAAAVATPRETVTTKAKLRRELAEVREQGYAVAVDELEVGLTADRGADPQRARRRDRLAERVRPDVPARREPGSRSSSPVVQDAADEVSRRLGLRNRPRFLTRFSGQSRNPVAYSTPSCDMRNSPGLIGHQHRAAALRRGAMGGRLARASAGRSAARRTVRWWPRSTRPARRTPPPPIAARPGRLRRGQLAGALRDRARRAAAPGRRPAGARQGARRPRRVAGHRQAPGRERVRRRRRRRGVPALRQRRGPGRRPRRRHRPRRRGQPDRARARRRLRPDHALELPAAADRVEGRALPGRGQHLRAQAQRAHPAHRDPPDGAARGGRRPGRRRQPRARRRPAGGRAAQRGPRASTWSRSPEGWRPAGGSWPRRPRP